MATSVSVLTQTYFTSIHHISAAVYSSMPWVRVGGLCCGVGRQAKASGEVWLAHEIFKMRMKTREEEEEGEKLTERIKCARTYCRQMYTYKLILKGHNNMWSTYAWLLSCIECTVCNAYNICLRILWSTYSIVDSQVGMRNASYT